MAPVFSAIGSIGAALGGSGSALGSILSIGGTIASVGAANRAAGAQREAIALQQRAQKLQIQRSRRQSIRQAQLMRAQQMTMGTAAGAQAGSGVAGGQSSIFSNLGQAFGFSTAGSGIARQISMANQSAATYNAQAGVGSAIAGFGTNVLGGNLSSFFQPQQQAPDLGVGITR